MSNLGPSNIQDHEITGGESQNLTSDQQSLIVNLRSQPTLAAKVLLGITLEWYQAKAIEDVWRKRFSIFCWSRQIGKTFAEAVLFSLLAVLYPAEDGVFIAPSLRQAMNPFNYVRDFYNNHMIFRSMIRGKVTKTRIEFKNSSTLVPLPMGDGCCAEALLMSDSGLLYIEDAVRYHKPGVHVLSNSVLIGETGFNKTEYFFYNGHVPIKIIHSKRGYQLKSSLIHPIKVARDNELNWVRAGELKRGDRIIIDRNENWFPNHNDITYEQAYCAGAMIGDGNYTQKYWLGFANAPNDREIVNYLNEAMSSFLGAQFVPISDEYHFIIRSQEKRLDFFRFFGFKDYSHLDERAYAKNKCTPPKILSCSKETMRGFLQGLFDTDGHVSSSKSGTMREIGFTNTSEKLVREIQTILLKFGIISSIGEPRKRKKTWNACYALKITGYDIVLFAERVGFRLKRKQDTLEALVKDSKRNYSLTDQIYHINNRLQKLENEFHLAQKFICDESGHRLWTRIIERIKKGDGITYALLEKFLEAYKDIDNVDITYLKDVYSKHYYYDEIESLEDSSADTYDAYIPGDHTFWSNGFISHNSKILGTHASIIGIDEYATFTREFIETVVMPMANRKKNPNSKGNRLSIIGTPLSKSNHYYETFCRYREEQTKNSDGDYHLSTYSFLDSDNMDMSILMNQAKAMTFERFARENLAEFTANTGGFFSEEIMRMAQDDINIEFTGESDACYVLGLDPPSVNNMGGFVILKLVDDNKKVDLVFCAGIPAAEITAPQLLNFAMRLVKRFNIRRLHIDQGGGGLQLAQMLFAPQIIVDDYMCDLQILLPDPLPEVVEWKGARNAEDPFSIVNNHLEPLIIQITPFSPHAKSAMYFNLKNAMQTNILKIPTIVYDKAHVETNMLQNEMEALRGRLTPSSYLSLIKPADGFDDRADAAVLAYDAYLGLIRGDTGATRVGSIGHEDVYRQSIGGFESRRDMSFPDRRKNDPWHNNN